VTDQTTAVTMARELSPATSLSNRLRRLWKQRSARNRMQADPGASLFCPGRNCWNVAAAERATVLVDGADYFRHLESSLRQAKRSIMIIGWDFDGRIVLRPQDRDEDMPALGPLLRRLVEAEPDLKVDILVWSVSVLHGPSAVAPALFGAEWQDHPRIRIKFDTHHPFYGSHHQKIVCVDGAVAFVGGMDLTVRRWDTREHRPADPRRVDCDGKPYPPVHDVQMVFDGAAAAAICAMAAERWRGATGEGSGDDGAGHKTGTRCDRGAAPWPEELAPDFRASPVAIARTEPAYAGHPEIRESSLQALDMIATARDAIYIEAQYLTAQSIGAALSRRLKAADGPDIVIVMTQESHGLLERLAMTENRDRLLRRLARADRHGRLRVFYPVVAGPEGEVEVLVHAKLIIADDRVIRIGSSNLNNRSIGLDTECDVAIEAVGPAERRTIAAIRNDLLAEHLDCEAGDLGAAIAELGLARAVDRFNTRPRHLKPFEVGKSDGPFHVMPGTRFLDPRHIFRLPWPFR